MRIRPARPDDAEQLAVLFARLWTDASEEEHRRELTPIVEGRPPGTMPLVIFVAEANGEVSGFIEVGLRSHADGCDVAVPVGYVEGWYVVEDGRRQGIARRLLETAEEWARAQGCVEMASDTWIDNEVSHQVHQALGFEVVDRCINYRKRL